MQEARRLLLPSSHDRTDLALPGKQVELIEQVAAAAKDPITLVILSGGPVDVSAAKANAKVGAIVWAGYPGQSGGDALAHRDPCSCSRTLCNGFQTGSSPTTQCSLLCADEPILVGASELCDPFVAYPHEGVCLYQIVA